MEQVTNLVMLTLRCPPLRRRIESGIAHGQIDTMGDEKLYCVFMTVDRRPVQTRPTENPFCINVCAALDQK